MTTNDEFVGSTRSAAGFEFTSGYKAWINSYEFRVLAAWVKRQAGDICSVCFAGGSLTAHHRHYRYFGEGSERESEDLLCLCLPCHRRVHEIAGEALQSDSEWLAELREAGREDWLIIGNQGADNWAFVLQGALHEVENEWWDEATRFSDALDRLLLPSAPASRPVETLLDLLDGMYA